MHIVIITKNMSAGGAERVISQLLSEWCTQNVTCSLILLDQIPHFYEIPENVTIHEIGRCGKNVVVNKFKQYACVRRIVRKVSPDIVLSLPEEIGIYVIGALLGTGIPVVVSERNNPWVMPNKKITRILRRLLYPFAAGLIFQTKQAESFFSKKNQAKGIVLPNPLDLSRIPEPYTGDRKKYIVSAGRLEVQKNFHLLVDAFSDFHKTHPDYKLIIYGEGALRGELENHAKDVIPADCISFPGRVTDLPERMLEAAAFVLSSDFEGVPNVLIEALAMGIPSVSTDCAPGGAAELIEDGKNGFLVPVGDCVQLSMKLSELVDNKEQSVQFSKASVKVKEVLDSQLVCKRWLKYLEKVISYREQVKNIT